MDGWWHTLLHGNYELQLCLKDSLNIGTQCSFFHICEWPFIWRLVFLQYLEGADLDTTVCLNLILILQQSSNKQLVLFIWLHWVSVEIITSVSGVSLNCKNYPLTDVQKSKDRSVWSEDMNLLKDPSSEGECHNWRHVKKQQDHWGREKKLQGWQMVQLKQLSKKVRLACSPLAEQFR